MSEFLTPEELGEKIRSIIPTADFSVDNEDQLIIYTNLRVEDGQLVLC